MKQKLLIIGSASFLLSNFIRNILYNYPNKYQIVSVDAFKNSNIQYNLYVNKGHQFYLADINNADLLNTIVEIEKPDIVIHGANDNLQTNIIGTQNIINACHNNKVKKLIYLSSDQVYGYKKELLIEESATLPVSLFGASKLSSEILIQTANRSYNFPYIILRACEIFGPRQQRFKFIPNAIASYINNKTLTIENSQDRKDWLYVEDFVTALLLLIESETVNQVYNLTGNQELSNEEVVEKISKQLNINLDLMKKLFVYDSKSNKQMRKMSSQKLKDLGWKPQYKFDNGLVMTINWFINNQYFIKG